MPTSRVLIVAHPDPAGLKLGAETAVTFAEARARLAENHFSVVAFPSGPDALDFARTLSERSPIAKKVLIGRPAGDELMPLLELPGFAGFAEHFEDPHFESLLVEALEEFDFDRQAEQLLDLANAQNEQLKRLSTELDRRIERRERTLSRAHKRIADAKARTEALHKALVAIHLARSVGEMENLLSQCLSRVMNLDWIRVLFEAQSPFAEIKDAGGAYTAFTATLWVESRPQGRIVFARSKGAEFSKDESDFLTQVSETVGLALDRLAKLEQAESLKQQWEATFDAIAEPLCLTDADFRILRTNRAFSLLTQKHYADLIGVDAFAAFLGRDEHVVYKESAEHFHITRTYGHEATAAVYEVSCHRFAQNPALEPLQVILFRDVTDQQRMERQILESAKLAELGTIGSSIAHELNNPLGGLISFLQLIKMDLDRSSPIYDDVTQMEGASQRCKEIVENLLGFSRMHEDSRRETFDLREAVQHSLKIVELMTRAQGIEVELALPEEPAWIEGQFNPLTQALRNVLQNACEAVVLRKRRQPRLSPKVTVELTARPDTYVLDIKDNGVGMSEAELKMIFNPLYTTKDPNTNIGLGLTVAFQIIQQHQGGLEFSSRPNVGTAARISLRRPDLPASSQVFDVKI